MDRPLLLLDEPFGVLDAPTRREMQNWLMTVWAQLQPTVLFVTHDVREAASLSDRVLVLSARPGRLIADVPIHFWRGRASESDEAFFALASAAARLASRLS